VPDCAASARFLLLLTLLSPLWVIFAGMLLFSAAD
jgi:hypothetical protein